MSLGEFQAVQTFATGAFAVASTMILFASAIVNALYAYQFVYDSKVQPGREKRL